MKHLALLLTLAAGIAVAAPREKAMQVTSSAFADGGAIPAKHSCEGGDAAPPLSWTDLPAGAKALALIVDDPDAPDPAAPKMTWVHWVAYNLPSQSKGLPEGGALPAGAQSGRNDFGKTQYGGPCPPVGRHRYFFKLYALDAALPDLKEPTKAQLEQAMKGHIVGQAQLIGTYQKG